jgi:hypothetical protein
MENDKHWYFYEKRGRHQFVFGRHDLPTSLMMNDATFDSLARSYERDGQFHVTQRDTGSFQLDLISEENPLDECVTLAEKLADGSRPDVTLPELLAYVYYRYLTTGQITPPTAWLTDIAFPKINTTRSLDCIDKEEWLQ